MKIFEHQNTGVIQPQELAVQLRSELHTVNDRECYHRCKLRAAWIFGVTYGPLSSWGRILKKYLEELEKQRPGILSALLANGVFCITAGNKKVSLIESELTLDRVERLKQPSRIGETEFFYDTLTDSKGSLKALRQVVERTNTLQSILVYVGV